MKKFKYELKTSVTILATWIPGRIISRCDDVNTKDRYLVLHQSPSNSKSIYEWVYESEIKLTPVVKKTTQVTKKTVVKKPVVKKRAVKKATPVPQPV